MTTKDNLRRLEILKTNPSIGDPFMAMIFPDSGNTERNQQILHGAVCGGIASEELINELTKFVPIVFKINGTLFLQGETIEAGEHRLTELFDMSEEMKSGHSSSLYVGGVSWFAYADAGETEQVKNFFANQK